jgi:hypothetical protein
MLHQTQFDEFSNDTRQRNIYKNCNQAKGKTTEQSKKLIPICSHHRSTRLCSIRFLCRFARRIKQGLQSILLTYSVIKEFIHVCSHEGRGFVEWLKNEHDYTQ